jgi:hypothetical protein
MERAAPASGPAGPLHSAPGMSPPDPMLGR